MNKKQAAEALAAFNEADEYGMRVESMQNVHKRTIKSALQSVIEAGEQEEIDKVKHDMLVYGVGCHKQTPDGIEHVPLLNVYNEPVLAEQPLSGQPSCQAILDDSCDVEISPQASGASHAHTANMNRHVAPLDAEDGGDQSGQPDVMGAVEALETIYELAGSYAEGPSEPEFSQFLNIESIARRGLKALRSPGMEELPCARCGELQSVNPNDPEDCKRCSPGMVNATGLKDRAGKPILYGQVVHWSDGGDDLPMEARITTRWDRIAVVEKNGIIPFFRVIDSPHEKTKREGHSFNYGNFIYKDTERYLTIVAESEADYHRKFTSAGECMVWVESMIAARPEGE